MAQKLVKLKNKITDHNHDTNILLPQSLILQGLEILMQDKNKQV